jgi:phytoene dehydrogenase-like protein
VLEANAVLLAGDPKTAAALYPNELLDEQTQTAVPVRAATLDVALDALPCPENLLALGLDEPTYLSVHSAVAKLAPEGGTLIQVARYLSPEENGSDFRDSLENLLDLTQPGWRQHLVHQRFLPNMVVANRTPLAVEGGLNGRPDVALTNRIFVAGDWTGPTGWLVEASLTSARAAARRILAQPHQLTSAVIPAKAGIHTPGLPPTRE